MYFICGILLAAGFLLSVCNYRRRKRVICRIWQMPFCEKYCKLNELIDPWGFSYAPSQDIVTSTLDAWQREFGYRSIYDKTASHFSMVFDCEPVYFDYRGRTWRIEFWKGQYGINTGGEIGVYYADSILLPEQYDSALFHSADDEHLLFLSMELYERGCPLFKVQQCHWWLTGFAMGKYSEPENLEMKVSVSFPDGEMCCCFIDGLLKKGYRKCDLSVCENTVTFSFPACGGGCEGEKSKREKKERLGVRRRWEQWKNRLFCRLYLQVTRPFSCTLDRLLYLYLMIPFAFRHMLHFRKNRKQKVPRERRRRV